MKQYLEGTDEQVRGFEDPADVVKLIRRLRKVTFFIHFNMELVTELPNDEGEYRAYNMPESIKVSAAQAMEYCEKMVGTNERFAKIGKKQGMMKICRLGSCLFLG